MPVEGLKTSHSSGHETKYGPIGAKGSITLVDYSLGVKRYVTIRCNDTDTGGDIVETTRERVRIEPDQKTISVLKVIKSLRTFGSGQESEPLIIKNEKEQLFTLAAHHFIEKSRKAA